MVILCILSRSLQMLLASGSQDDTVKLWNVRSGECVKTLSGHSERVYSVSFSPDGTLLASTGAYYGEVKWWNVGSGRETSQQMWDAIGKKDSPIEEKKTLIGRKDTLIEEKDTQMEEQKTLIGSWFFPNHTL